MTDFIAANPVATGVMFVAAICAVAFVVLLGRWAAVPTKMIVRPSDFGSEGEQ